MSTASNLTRRGPYATPGAQLPGLQGLRLADPQAQRAFEALREWVEVRLGSRGDAFEKAVTRREFEQLLADVFDKTKALGDFNGDAATLRGVPLDALPSTVTLGAFIPLKTGALYYGTQAGWKQVTLT